MKRAFLLPIIALLWTLPAFAQPSLCTITGNLYDSTGSVCSNCKITISKARQGSTPLNAPPIEKRADSNGAVSFTAVQGSFITITGTFSIGRYNFASGLEMYVPLQSSATLTTLQTAEDALNALISTTSYAPADIPVITKTASGSLSNEFALGSLATGILKNTTTTGVPTIAVAETDYSNPLTFAARLSRVSNTVDLAASGVSAGNCTNCDLTIDTYGRVTAKANGSGGGGTVSSVFGRTGAVVAAQDDYTFAQLASKPTTLTGYGITDAQGLDSDLTAIGGLSPSNDDIIQRKAGVWTNRTVAQFKSDLGLATIATSGSASDLGSGTIPDARFPSTLPALNGSALTNLNASNLASGTVPLARISGLTNTEIDNAAAIAYSKLNLSGSIVNADISNSAAIAYSKLNLTGAIVNGDLAGSIANAKLANSAITIAGTSTSLGGSITASTILDSIGSTRGSVLYRGASGWAILTPGTSGHVLTSNGAGADPSYQAAAGGSPGGSDTQLQRNNGGAFGGISGATSNGTSVTFTSGNLIATDAALTTPAITTSATVTRNSLGTTNATGFELVNNTAAAAGAQQISPDFVLTAQGWKTTATAASQTVNFRQYVLPVQGAANPTANWVLQSQINGGGYATKMTVTSAGQILSSGDGVAATPIFASVNSTGTGMYFPGGNQIAFSLSSSDKLFLSGNDLYLAGTNPIIRDNTDTGASSITLTTRGKGGFALDGSPVYIKGGTAGTSGNRNGGNVYLIGGAKGNSGTDGDVYLGYDGSTARGGVFLGATQKLLWGSGSPESAVTAPVGSIYLRSDGGASTTLYIKESGSGNTGWVGK